MPEIDPNTTEDDGYRLLQVLTTDRTFLCSDASENRVVLKRLDQDCLHRDQLHPSIRDRLAKIRQLAHPGIAPLRGVERWNGQVFLVWVYLEGDNWDKAVAKPTADLLAMTHELTTSVEALHELGLVHGNIQGRNIIVRPNGQIWLTDISPYLYTDPQIDIAAIHFLSRENVVPLRNPSAGTIQNQTGLYRATSLVVALICILLALAFGMIYPVLLQKSMNHSPATFPSLK